jgi:hypothetical protein
VLHIWKYPDYLLQAVTGYTSVKLLGFIIAYEPYRYFIACKPVLCKQLPESFKEYIGLSPAIQQAGVCYGKLVIIRSYALYAQEVLFVKTIGYN